MARSARPRRVGDERTSQLLDDEQRAALAMIPQVDLNNLGVARESFGRVLAAMVATTPQIDGSKWRIAPYLDRRALQRSAYGLSTRSEAESRTRAVVDARWWVRPRLALDG